MGWAETERRDAERERWASQQLAARTAAAAAAAAVPLDQADLGGVDVGTKLLARLSSPRSSAALSPRAAATTDAAGAGGDDDDGVSTVSPMSMRSSAAGVDEDAGGSTQLRRLADEQAELSLANLAKMQTSVAEALATIRAQSEVGSPSGSVPRLGAGAFFDDDEKREIGMERAEVEATKREADSMLALAAEAEALTSARVDAAEAEAAVAAEASVADEKAAIARERAEVEAAKKEVEALMAAAAAAKAEAEAAAEAARRGRAAAGAAAPRLALKRACGAVEEKVGRRSADREGGGREGGGGTGATWGEGTRGTRGGRRASPARRRRAAARRRRPGRGPKEVAS